MNETGSNDIHFYEPAKGHGLRHDPFNAIVGPRPIGWISSRDAKGNIHKALENQCAMRLTECFKTAGVSTKTFKGARCWNGHGHILRAEEMGKWLATRRTDFGPVEKKKGKKS